MATQTTNTSDGALKIDPLHQFDVYEIVPLMVGQYNLSFTNMSLYMVLAAVVIAGFLMSTTRKTTLIPGRLQSLAEMSYEFVSTIIRENAGSRARGFFPIIYTLFSFILMSNMIGMLPFSFTTTSHIGLTLTMALSVFLIVTGLSIWHNGLIGFGKKFVPSGLPILLTPFLFVVEFISYMMRPISLSVRLFANMLAGHIMLKVFASFVGALGFLGVLPFVFMIPLTLLEFLVAFLQAYVFTALTCIYLGEALNKDTH